MGGHADLVDLLPRPLEIRTAGPHDLQRGISVAFAFFLGEVIGQVAEFFLADGLRPLVHRTDERGRALRAHPASGVAFLEYAADETRLMKEAFGGDDDEASEPAPDAAEPLNTMKAIWIRSTDEVDDDELKMAALGSLRSGFAAVMTRAISPKRRATPITQIGAKSLA